MPASSQSSPESMRIAALRSYGILDTPPEAVFDDLAELAARLTGSPVAAVSLVDRSRLWFKAHHGFETTQARREGSHCAHAILDPTVPLLVEDTRQDPRFQEAPAMLGDAPLPAYAGVALVGAEGHALGTLFVMDRIPRRWAEPEVADLRRLARLAVSVLECRRLEIRSASLSLTDPGTGLPNRRALLDSLGRALARQRRDGLPVTVLCLGLSGPAGVSNELLDASASALLQCIRAEDMPGRIGEASFGAVLVGGDGAEGAVVSERLRTAVLACIEAGGGPALPSVGAVCFVEPPDEDEEEALEMAERLLEEAASGGGGRVICREHLPQR